MLVWPVADICMHVNHFLNLAFCFGHIIYNLKKKGFQNDKEGKEGTSETEMIMIHNQVYTIKIPFDVLFWTDT